LGTGSGRLLWLSFRSAGRSWIGGTEPPWPHDNCA
jgi:hypothetical protein